MYPPFYIEPTYKVNHLKELYESGQAQKQAFLPVKATRNDQNASIFHDEITSKFINTVMKKGDRLTARGLVEQAFVKVKQVQLAKYRSASDDAERAEIELDPTVILRRAIENCKPLLQLTPIKRGGSTYQVPIPITERHASFMAMKWLIIESQTKHRRTHFPEKLASELLDAAAGVGKVVKKKQDLHRQCEANRAYAHYRWG